VGSTAGLDCWIKEKYLAPAGNITLNHAAHSLVTVVAALPQLTYFFQVQSLMHNKYLFTFLQYLYPIQKKSNLFHACFYDTLEC